jgi:hypothetical protein
VIYLVPYRGDFRGAADWTERVHTTATKVITAELLWLFVSFVSFRSTFLSQSKRISHWLHSVIKVAFERSFTAFRMPMPSAREVSTAFCKLIGHARTQKLHTMDAKITKACAGTVNLNCSGGLRPSHSSRASPVGGKLMRRSEIAAISRNNSAYQVRQNRFLDVQAILGLVENCLRVRFKCCVVNLLAAMCGKTMHDQCVRLGQLHQ